MVPILVGGATLPAPAVLPPDLAGSGRATPSCSGTRTGGATSTGCSTRSRRLGIGRSRTASGGNREERRRVTVVAINGSAALVRSIRRTPTASCATPRRRSAGRSIASVGCCGGARVADRSPSASADCTKTMPSEGCRRARDPGGTGADAPGADQDRDRRGAHTPEGGDPADSSATGPPFARATGLAETPLPARSTSTRPRARQLPARSTSRRVRRRRAHRPIGPARRGRGDAGRGRGRARGARIGAPDAPGSPRPRVATVLDQGRHGGGRAWRRQVAAPRALPRGIDARRRHTGGSSRDAPTSGSAGPSGRSPTW